MRGRRLAPALPGSRRRWPCSWRTEHTAAKGSDPCPNIDRLCRLVVGRHAKARREVAGEWPSSGSGSREGQDRTGDAGGSEARSATAGLQATLQKERVWWRGGKKHGSSAAECGGPAHWQGGRGAAFLFTEYNARLYSVARLL
jgi:hypothetical protein